MLLNVCVCVCEREDGMGRKGLHLSPPASSALGLQGVRGSSCRAEYHRGDWEIKADCLELVWSGLASSFGSPSDPIMVPLPDLDSIEIEWMKGEKKKPKTFQLGCGEFSKEKSEMPENHPTFIKMYMFH